ncbi:MAG: hypothetical protein K8S87_03915 [Planctomycetes bacterium]|nr:hypothetical protein [Planctomycetota bacterium]
MFFHLLLHKKGGGKLFAFFTILCIAGAIWAYFLLYVPTFEKKISKPSEIEQLIEDAKTYLSENDYLNALEVVKVANTLENIEPVYVDTLKTLENQAVLQEFESTLEQAEELSVIGAIVESDAMLKQLRSR